MALTVVAGMSGPFICGDFYQIQPQHHCRFRQVSSRQAAGSVHLPARRRQPCPPQGPWSFSPKTRALLSSGSSHGSRVDHGQRARNSSRSGSPTAALQVAEVRAHRSTGGRRLAVDATGGDWVGNAPAQRRTCVRGAAAYQSASMDAAKALARCRVIPADGQRPRFAPPLHA